MIGKNVVIVNCFETNNNRVDLLYQWYSSHNDKVVILQSDYLHHKKEFINTNEINNELNKKFIHVMPYNRNLSIKRLLSHYYFSKEVSKNINDFSPDMIHVLAPPNSLVKMMAKYKKQNPKTFLIVDIVDVWPESLPVPKLIKMNHLFYIWKKMRNKNINVSDLIILECDLFKNHLPKKLETPIYTLYLAKNEESKYLLNLRNPKILTNEEIRLCYLGSVNNIIDMDYIERIIKHIYLFKKIIIHIIGVGEKLSEFHEMLEKNGCLVHNHGIIYDEKEKLQIMNECNFGLNIMKRNVEVGLTMKSIDYFQNGLAVINNIPADTADLIYKYKAGVNICKHNFKDGINSILNISDNELIEMKTSSRKLFEDNFSAGAFQNGLKKIFKEGVYIEK